MNDLQKMILITLFFTFMTGLTVGYLAFSVSHVRVIDCPKEFCQ